MRTRVVARTAAALLLLAAVGCRSGKPAPSASTPPASTPQSSSSSSSPTGAGLAATIAKYGDVKLDWVGCGGGFECTKITVPLDYAAPDGDTIVLSMIRLPADDPAHRIGSLLLNPGGPGGSGMEFGRLAKSLLPNEIRDRFDVVSWDPRGVGDSAPVDCVGDAALDALLGADPLPDTPTEHDNLLAKNRDFAAACKQKSGTLLPHIATVDTAKDLDVLRTALGDDKLTYVGFSYGTLLGARYAEQFPTHVRALVLDGAVNPALPTRDLTLAQAVGFDTALNAFLNECVRIRCAFASHGDVFTTYDTLMARIEKTPLRSSQSSRMLGPGEALFGVAAGLYSKESGWPTLRAGLESAYSRGDGATLLALFDNIVERDTNGHYSNSVEALSAVTCVDGVYPKDPAAYDADARAFKAKAPRFGPSLAYGPVACAYWPVPPVSSAGPIHAAGAPPILVVGTTRDPATPYAWAQALARQLPGTLLTYEGDGHTAYGFGRSACVNRVVDAYLLRLAVPKAGTRCG